MLTMHYGKGEFLARLKILTVLALLGQEFCFFYQRSASLKR